MNKKHVCSVFLSSRLQTLIPLGATVEEYQIMSGVTFWLLSRGMVLIHGFIAGIGMLACMEKAQQSFQMGFVLASGPSQPV